MVAGGRSREDCQHRCNSLQIAQFEMGHAGLGKKVMECAVRYVDKKIVINYAGLLLTDELQLAPAC
jgi:hypothetical protein